MRIIHGVDVSLMQPSGLFCDHQRRWNDVRAFWGRSWHQQWVLRLSQPMRDQRRVWCMQLQTSPVTSLMTSMFCECFDPIRALRSVMFFFCGKKTCGECVSTFSNLMWHRVWVIKSPESKENEHSLFSLKLTILGNFLSTQIGLSHSFLLVHKTQSFLSWQWPKAEPSYIVNPNLQESPFS